jgi:hypothetical protein
MSLIDRICRSVQELHGNSLDRFPPHQLADRGWPAGVSTSRLRRSFETPSLGRNVWLRVGTPPAAASHRSAVRPRRYRSNIRRAVMIAGPPTEFSERATRGCRIGTSGVLRRRALRQEPSSLRPAELAPLRLAERPCPDLHKAGLESLAVPAHAAASCGEPRRRSAECSIPRGKHHFSTADSDSPARFSDPRSPPSLHQTQWDSHFDQAARTAIWWCRAVSPDPGSLDVCRS